MYLRVTESEPQQLSDLLIRHLLAHRFCERITDKRPQTNVYRTVLIIYFKQLRTV